jgi:mevalonate kinase
VFCSSTDTKIIDKEMLETLSNLVSSSGIDFSSCTYGHLIKYPEFLATKVLFSSCGRSNNHIHMKYPPKYLLAKVLYLNNRDIIKENYIYRELRIRPI